MAPSPENDNTPKAPDKIKLDKHVNNDVNKDKNKDFKTLNNLNDCELKDLLDEAITYKNPKDREGKSTLFKELLSQAEESERNARAASASGSEQVRYCNTSAKRSKHRRKPNSISENMMHGGSLDNLAKEELFEVTHHLNRPRRTVSARQREGGSLPSNVNSGSSITYDPHFLEEARRKRALRSGGRVEPMDVDSETVSLLDHDSVAQNYDMGAPVIEVLENPLPTSALKFTTMATLQINVDDPLHLNDLEPVEKKPYDSEQINAKVIPSKHSIYGSLNEAKKVDENGNALHQNTKGKKKKIQSDKNVVSCCAAEKVEGHRSDIIHDVDKLVEYIVDDKPQGSAPSKTNTHRSNKQLHKHTSEEGPRSGKKQRTQSSKGKENNTELKKSNSLGEISTSKLDNFSFNDAVHDGHEQGENEVVLRAKKESTADKPRERRSWGNVEQHPAMQNFYKNPSTENLEASSTSDFRVVTKKKKTKKRRNSVSEGRRKISNVTSHCANSSKSDGDRTCSPAPRRKSTCSVPHSERSNDSSDVDSVHSLPIDTSQRIDSSLNSEDAPISYADIARNSDRKQHESHKKPQPEAKVIIQKENSPQLANTNDQPTPEMVRTTKVVSHSFPTHHPPDNTPSVNADALKVAAHVQSQTTTSKAPPPDVHNIKSFPAIPPANTKIDRSVKIDNRVNHSRGGGNNRSNQQQIKQNNMVQCNNVANVNKNTRNQATNYNQQSNADNKRDIQNDLSIIQANEIETIQYNSQIMPTIQIPDVQTIEKIHFMNQQGAHMTSHIQQHVVTQQHHVHVTPTSRHHQAQLGHHHVGIAMIPPLTEIFTNGRTPAAYTAVISHTPHSTHAGMTYVKTTQAYEGVGVTYVDHSYIPPTAGIKDGASVHVVVPNVIENHNVRSGNLVTVTTQTTNNSESNKHIKNLNNNKTADDENGNNSNNNRQTKSKYNKKSHPVNELKPNSPGPERYNKEVPPSVSPSTARSSSHSSLASTVIAFSDASTSSECSSRQGFSRALGAESLSHDDSCASICDTRTNASDCTSSEDSLSDTRPPVVILSGSCSGKEVPGLVFGFDVNEQLLSEDICENFEQRFQAPANITTTSHNHDKIVNFVGSAWEETMKHQSIGKAQYFSDLV